MSKLKFTQENFFSSDYSKYPLHSLKPFLILFFILIFLFVLTLFVSFVNTNILIEFSKFLIIIFILLYWIYIFKKIPKKKLGEFELIRKQTRFEKQTALDKLKKK